MKLDILRDIQSKNAFVSTLGGEFFVFQKIGIVDYDFVSDFSSLSNLLIHNILNNGDDGMINFKYKLFNTVFKNFYQKLLSVSIELDDVAYFLSRAQEFGVI